MYKPAKIYVIILLLLIPAYVYANDSEGVVKHISSNIVPIYFRVLWTYNTTNTIWSTPCVGDINGDGYPEVIFGNNDGVLYVLYGKNGSKLWEFHAGGAIRSSPSLVDLDNDSRLDIVVGSDNGCVYGLDGDNGSILWIFNTSTLMIEPQFFSPVIENTDADGSRDIVIVERDGRIYSISISGRLEWFFKAESFVRSSPSVGDADGDGELEVVFGSYDKRVYVVNGEDGSLLWNVSLNDYIFSSPCLVDVDGDSDLEIIVGCFDGYVYCLDCDSKDILWKIETDGQIWATPAIGDLDGDLSLDIVIATNNGSIYVAKTNGTVSYKFVPSINFSYWITSITLADITGDNWLDAVFGSTDGHIYVLDGKRLEIVAGFNVYSLVEKTAPIVADVNLDGHLDILFGCTNGVFYALSSTRTSTRIYWESLSGDTLFRRTKNIDCVDSDHDFVSDYTENLLGINPRSSDSDGDSIPDSWELSRMLDPSDPSDAKKDPDNDGLNNLKEYKCNTDPLNPDTDDDGYADGVEVEKGTDPLDPNDFPVEVPLRVLIFFVLSIVSAVSIIIIALYIRAKKLKTAKKKSSSLQE